MTPEEVLENCHDHFDQKNSLSTAEQRWLLKRAVTLTVALKIVELWLGSRHDTLANDVILRALYEQDSATLPLGTKDIFGKN